MPNPDFNQDFNNRRHSAKPPPNNSPGSGVPSTEKTAAWSLGPGKKGPNRSGGTTKLKTYAKQEGV